MSDTNYYVIFIQLLVCHFVSGQTWSQVREVKQQLFTDYDASIRPILDQAKSLQITLGFKIRSIVSADVVSGQLVLRGFVAATWTDEHLAWNETQTGVQRITVTDQDIWVPEFIFTQPLSGEMMTSLKLLSSGEVIMMMIGNIETHCDLNMRNYPMDAHYCSISVMCGGYLKELVTLNSDIDGILDHILPHGEWVIDNASVVNENFIEPFTGNHIDVLNLSLLLTRRHEFNALHKFAPQCLLLFVNLFMHIVPFDCGERVSFSATIFLAYVFWQTIVVEDLPQNSAKISYYSIILTLCMALSTMGVVMSIFLCRMACEKDKPIPKSLCDMAIYVRKLKRREKRLENRNRQTSTNTDTAISNLSRIAEDDVHEMNDVHEINDSSEDAAKLNDNNDRGGIKTTKNSVDVKHEREIEVTWLDIANLIDAAFFVGSIILILIGSVIFCILFIVL